MLKKLFKRFGNQNQHPTVITSHSIDRTLISPAAIRVTEGLQAAGYSAYVVGGGVRDLLLEDKPKDFDVATNATPEEVTKIFKRARIIGRRFQIVHVRFGREMIEVTTFRGHHQASKEEKKDAVQSDKGILLRDNVFGDIESDALRRDFTINALYYDPSDETIIDYTDGIEDLASRSLRIIGEPDARYKEDPVRMLRAVRFSVKLGFKLSPETEKPIREHSEYLSHIPAARLFEESLKLMMSGYATAIVRSLKEYHLLEYLVPTTHACLEKGSEQDKKLIELATSNTDRRIRNNQRVTPAFIYAALLWPALRREMEFLVNDQKLTQYDALQRAAQGIISQQLSYTAIPKRFLIPMREIWTLQLRLPSRYGKRAYQLMGHPRFRAAYDFCLLREDSGEQLDGLGSWWTRFQAADDKEKEKLIANLPKSKGRHPRRRKKPNTPKPE